MLKTYLLFRYLILLIFCKQYYIFIFKCILLTTVTDQLQKHLLIHQHWFHKSRIKINENKSTHITFTLGQKNSQPIKINNKITQTQNSV